MSLIRPIGPINSMFRRNKGFTLIELLVVIAIIGILATIVLINLNAARNKAKDAAIKAALSEVRTAAEMYYDDQTPNTYVGVCSAGDLAGTGDFGRIRDNINDNGGTSRNCYDSVSLWCAQVTNLPGGGGWCVDSTGVSGSTIVCDAVNFNCATD